MVKNRNILGKDMTIYRNFEDDRYIDANPYSGKWRPYILNALKDYLHYGGYPELFKTPDELKLHTLNEYFPDTGFPVPL